MTECNEFQKQFSADPAAVDRFFSEHADRCAECAEFARHVLLLHRRLLSVMEVPVPASLQDRLQRIPVRERSRSLRSLTLATLALAASIVLGVGLFNFGSLPFRTEPGLQQVVYEHIVQEPEALKSVFPVKRAILNTTLKEFGVEFPDAEFGEVRYVRICPIADTRGLHLVVQGQRGPVTLLFMPTQSVEARIPFEEGRFAGHINPIAVGLVAIVGEKGEALDRFDRAIRQSIRWL
ncbi:MAG: DUF3379 domain-containing protein [Methylococcaceae bacterium]|nr:DUF3379 domain-containing protein [Methylococcaceae bacterium]